MQIEFKECNWSELWLWFEFANEPMASDRQYLEQVLESWYTLGMLGGFNATALFVQDAGLDIDYFEYDSEADQLPALMHNMGNVEYQGCWGRCWFDLGTADAIAIDVLLNTLNRLSLEYASLKRVIVGGQLPEWPLDVEDHPMQQAYLN